MKNKFLLFAFILLLGIGGCKMGGLEISKDATKEIETDNDIIAANNAGITSVFFTYGYNRGDSKKMHYDYKFDKFSQLTDLIKKLQQQKV